MADQDHYVTLRGSASDLARALVRLVNAIAVKVEGNG